MSFTSLFLFFFGAIGVFNSFLVSLYFIFFKRPKKLSNTLFGLFLLFLSERALRSLIYFFSDPAPNSYSTFGPITFLFIGPFLFLYVLAVIKTERKILALWKYHIVFWVSIAIASHFIYPFRGDPIFWKKYVLKGINLQWLFYLLLSGWFLFKNGATFKLKKDQNTVVNLWLLLLLASVSILWLIYYFVSFSYFATGSIVFSIIFYTFYLFFIFNKKYRSQLFQEDKKYISKKIDNEIATRLVKQLEALMDKQKPHKNPNVKSSDIAKELGISTHQFSQLLNDNLGKSFTFFLNEHRIEEAKHLIQFNTKYTLDAIGNEAGFHSKSTFYTYFKKIVGMTPSKYKEQF